jgi:hypothetical protein
MPGNGEEKPKIVPIKHEQARRPFLHSCSPCLVP